VSLVTIFGAKSSIILCPKFFLQHFKNKIICNLVKFVATKKDMTTNFFLIPLFVAVFGSGMGKNNDRGSGIRKENGGK
jgi:hypothetical protein